MRDPGCVFCQIAGGRAPADVVESSPVHVAFRPHRPHTPGHVLFVPRDHVRDAAESPTATAVVMSAAARYIKDVVRGPANIITSVGAEASQTVYHLHVHVVPRGEDDAIRRAWPWRIRLSEPLLPGDILPEEGHEELRAQLIDPGRVPPPEDGVDDGPSAH